MSTSDDITVSKSELIGLHVAIGVLTRGVEELTEKTSRQDRVLEDLVALANQGKGSMWILVALGGAVGAILSNIKTLATLLVR